MKSDFTKDTGHTKLFLFVVFIMFLANTVSATEYQQLYKGIRPLGMGGAFAAVADGPNALFYNPAGLAKMEKGGIGIDPLIEISKKIIDVLEDASDADLDESDEVADIMRDYVGDRANMRLAMTPHLRLKIGDDIGAMISGLFQTRLQFEVHNPAWPEAYVFGIAEAGLLGGFGIKISAIEGLNLGASIKVLQRENLYQRYTATDIADQNFDDAIDDDRDSGSGFSMDFGALYRLPMIDIVDMDLAIVFQNFPEMDMGDALDVKSQVNIGIAVSKVVSDILITGALDYQDITKELGENELGKNDDDLPKRLYMGVEAKFPKILSLRAGLHQGYLSFGATINLWILTFDGASYVEELGAYAGQRDDRRYVAQFMFGW